jgi:putative ABC transport system ATP-binding protein
MILLVNWLLVMNLLKTIWLSKKIDSSVINYWDFKVNSWDFTIITGDSGTGKTTLLKLLAWLDIDFSWQVKFWEGLDLNDIFYSFQDFLLLDNLTIKENLCFWDKNLEQKEFTIEDSEKILSAIWLSWYSSRMPLKLSSWELQRICLARVFIKKSKLIILDEPTSNLDISNRLLINNMIIDLHKKWTTIIVTTHNPAEYEYFLSKISKDKLNAIHLWGEKLY